MSSMVCYYMAHEMIKAVLTYEAETVQEILSKKYPKWKIINTKRYRVIATRPELPLGKSFGFKRGFVYPDVIWVLKSHTHEITQYVIHEVKTGRYYIWEVASKYKGYYLNRESIKFGKLFLKEVATSTTPLFLWAWKREHERNLKMVEEMDLEIKSLRRGGIRLIPIELILPLVRKRVLDACEIIGLKIIDLPF